jgi:hypothetical protein
VLQVQLGQSLDCRRIHFLALAQSGSYWYEPGGDETAEPNWTAQKFIEV